MGVYKKQFIMRKTVKATTVAPEFTYLSKEHSTELLNICQLVQNHYQETAFTEAFKDASSNKEDFLSLSEAIFNTNAIFNQFVTILKEYVQNQQLGIAFFIQLQTCVPFADIYDAVEDVFCTYLSYLHTAINDKSDANTESYVRIESCVKPFYRAVILFIKTNQL